MFPEIDYPYRAFGKVFSARYMKELSDFGNSIISSFTLIDKNVIYTKGNTIEDIETLNTEYDYNIRNFVHAVFEIGESTLNIITHHGHHDPFSKEGSDENTRQMQILADYIALLKGPVILTGDFNLHPKSSSLEPINKLLRNLAVEYNIESTRSELAKRQEVIDYIFVSDDLVVNDFYASEMIVSDHKALILEFDL
jgi:endonuclease/exonuclease/phosphatase family metal-dependent hydrolase